MATPIDLSLNGGQVVIEQTDDTSVIVPSSIPKMATGIIRQVSYTDHKYNIGDNVAFLASEAIFFKQNGTTYGLAEEKVIFFKYLPLS